jgi:hypothetical protein
MTEVGRYAKMRQMLENELRLERALAAAQQRIQELEREVTRYKPDWHDECDVT